MDTTLDKEENAKNIYVIMRKLTTLRPIGSSYYQYNVGNKFAIRMWTKTDNSNASLINHKTVDVSVIEYGAKDLNGFIREDHLSLRDDPRFRDYEPIFHKTFEGPNGIVNLSDGRDMPILQLCELIRLLHRLANLTAFL